MKSILKMITFVIAGFILLFWGIRLIILSTGIHQNIFLPAVPWAAKSMITFSSDTGKFFIQYPSNWHAMDLPNGNHGDKDQIASIAGPFSNPYIGIAAKYFADINMENVKEWASGRAASSHQYSEFAASAEYASSAKGGMIYEYGRQEDFIFGTNEYHCLDWYTIKHHTGYVFSFCSIIKDWPEFEQIAHQMINTIQID